MNMEDVEASMYCPTWKYSYVGWRKLVAKLRVPYPVINIEIRNWFVFKKYLKQEKERVFYQFNGKTVCSYENYDFLQKTHTADLGG